MPQYEFMDDNGRIIEAFFSMKDVPDIGQVVDVPDPDHHGQTIQATRIMSMPQAQQVWKPYISNRLPRNLKGVPCTPSGKPIINTQAQERDIMRRFGYERE